MSLSSSRRPGKSSGFSNTKPLGFSISVETLAKKHHYNAPIYFDQAMYAHDHINNDEKQKKFVASFKKHLGKNHNKTEIRVEVNGVYEVI